MTQQQILEERVWENSSQEGIAKIARKHGIYGIVWTFMFEAAILHARGKSYELTPDLTSSAILIMEGVDNNDEAFYAKAEKNFNDTVEAARTDVPKYGISNRTVVRLGRKFNGFKEAVMEFYQGVRK